VRKKVIGLATAVAIFASTLVSMPAQAAEPEPVAATIPSTTLPDAPLVEAVNITTDQGNQPTETVKVTATTDHPVEATNDSISIVNADTQETVQTCETGTTCDFNYQTADFAPEAKFFARTANLTSNSVQVLNATPTLILTSDLTQGNTNDEVRMVMNSESKPPSGKKLYYVHVPTGEVKRSCADWQFGAGCPFSILMYNYDQVDKTFKAVIADDNGGSNISQLTNIIAESNTITITQSPIVFNLTTDTPFIEEGSGFWLNGKANQNLPTGYKIYYYDITAKKFIISDYNSGETNGQSCYDDSSSSKCSTHFAYDKTHTYQGFIAKLDPQITKTSLLTALTDVRAMSNPLTIRQLPWALSIKSTIPWSGTDPVYQAVVNQSTTYYYYALINQATGEIYRLCSGSPTCSWTDRTTITPEKLAVGGLTAVVGRWTGDTTGEKASQSYLELPGGQMHDIQAFYIYSYPALSGQPITPGDRPSIADPGIYTNGYNPSQPCAQTCVADPVNTVTGEFFLNKKDVTVESSNPLKFTRYYGISKRNTLKDMGYGWNSNYNMSIVSQTGTNLDASSGLTVIQENGSTISFTKNSTGTYSTSLVTNATLTKVGTTFVLTRDKKTSFTFTALGVLTSIKDLHGNVTTLNYTNGKLITVTNGKGQQLSFTWNAAGLLASVTTPAGKTTSYGYSTGKNLNKVTFPDGTFETYVHNGEHMIMDMFDRKNNKTTNTYDADKKVTAQIDPLLNKIVFTYEANATVITQPNGRKDKHHFNSQYQVYRIQTAVDNTDEYNEYYEFDAAGNTISTTYPNGGTVENTYDTNGNILKAKDRQGNITTSTYNSLGLLLTETNPAGKIRSLTYDPNGNLLTEKDYKQNTTTYVPNSDGTIQSITAPDNTQTLLTYNANGLVTTIKDPANNTTSQTFNADGEPLTITNANNKTRTLTHNTVGKVTKTVHPNLSQETTEYDANSNITASTDRTGKTTTQIFDALNRVISVTDPNGNTVTQQYDKMGNITKTIDQAGKETAITYNILNLPTSTTDANGKKTQYEYDELGNLIRTTNANSNRTVYNYDANNKLLETIQPNNVKTSTIYNNLGQPIVTTNTQRLQTSYLYDDNGNLITTIYPNQSTEQTLYDNMNRKTQYTDGDGGIKKWSYDTSGRTKTFTNTDNTSTAYTYDAVGNLLVELRPGNTTATYEYSDTDQMTKEIYSDSTTEFIYDTADRIIKEKQGPDETSYTYDANGNMLSRGPPTGAKTSYTYTPRNEIASITYPSGKKVTNTYDNVGNLLSAVNAETGTFTYTYDNISALASETNPNGTQQTYKYNTADQLTQTLLKKNLTTLYQKDYNYSARSGLVEKTTTTLSVTAPKVEENYTYDNMGRLASNTSNQTTSGAYKYSNTGNLTTKLGETQIFNAANQITATNVKTDLLYTSDIRGNRTIQRDATTKIIDRNYAYNQRNQLAGTGSYGETVYYAYDANGLLKRRTKNAVDKKFIWDYNSSVPTLLDDGDYEYIYTVSNTPAAQINKTTGAVTYLHAAETGSVVSATNSNGDVVGAYAYTAYGDIETPAGVMDPEHSQTRFGYAGEWKDPETGLYNLRARWYEPTTGNFLTRDPVEQDTNEVYSYASGNPYLYTDPLGLWSITDPSNVKFNSTDISTLSTVVSVIGLTALAFTPFGAVAGAILIAGSLISLGSAAVAMYEGNEQNIAGGLIGALPGVSGLGVKWAGSRVFKGALEATPKVSKMFKMLFKTKTKTNPSKSGSSMEINSTTYTHNNKVKNYHNKEGVDDTLGYIDALYTNISFGRFAFEQNANIMKKPYSCYP
jgi:RHS repeat-associated protein